MFLSCVFINLIFVFLTSGQDCNKNNIMGATCGAGTSYPSGASEFIVDVLGGSCYLIFSFSVQCFVGRCFSFYPLHCLSFHLWLLITPLVSSSFYPLHCLSFHLWLLITPLVSSSFYFRADYPELPEHLYLKSMMTNGILIFVYMWFRNE